MEPSGKLRQPSLPRNRRSKEERIKAGIVEALAEERARRQDDARFRIRNCQKPFTHILKLPSPHATQKEDHVPDLSLQCFREALDLFATVAQDNGRTPLIHGRKHILYDLPITCRIGNQGPAQAGIIHTSVFANFPDWHSKGRRAHVDEMVKRLTIRQGPGIDAMANGSALHHD